MPNTKAEAAFLYLAPGSDPTRDRSILEDDADRTTFVAVPDQDSAAQVALELVDHGVELVELYGGFGPTAAARVIEAVGRRVPVGSVGYQGPAAPADPVIDHRAVIYQAGSADQAVDRLVFQADGQQMTFVAVPFPAAAAPVAVELVDQGIQLIELCGGLGPVPAADVIEAIGGRVPVGVVQFGAESLAGASAYAARHASPTP